MEIVSNHPATTTVRPIVSELTKALLPLAVRKKSFIINNVPQGIEVAANQQQVIQVLNGILNAFVTYATDSCIRITVEKTFGNMMQLSIRDNNSCHPYAVACSLQRIVPLAEKLGGQIAITNQRQRITTITCRLPLAIADEAQRTDATWLGAA
jgi:signal transduction histidine kinase